MDLGGGVHLCLSLLCPPHVFPNSCVPSASDHPVPRPCNVCLPRRSQSAREPPAPCPFLRLTLDLPYERALSVSPPKPWAPQHPPALSRLRLSRRTRLLSSLTRSGLCRYPAEGHVRSLLPPLPPRVRRSLDHNPLQVTLHKPSRLQSYIRPSQLRQSRRSQRP